MTMTASTRRLCLVALALFACKPAAAPRAPDEPVAAPATSTAIAGSVVAIELTGTTREQEARAALRTTTGAPFDAARIAADVRALWGLGGLADVEVDARPVPGGVALRYRVSELPRVRKVEIEGGSQVLAALWKVRVADIKDVRQDPAALQRLTTDLQDDLVASAYLDAVVTRRSVPADDGRVDIVLKIDAGPRVTLAALDFRGNSRLRNGELEGIFRAHGLAVGQPFVGSGRDAALLAVTSRYQDVGRLQAEVIALPETRSADRSTITLAFEMREGETFRVGKLKFTGALIAPVRDYERQLAVRPRQIFSRSQIVAGIEKIRAMHRERGKGEPEVTTLTEVDAAAHTLDLTFEIKAP